METTMNETLRRATNAVKSEKALKLSIAILAACAITLGIILILGQLIGTQPGFSVQIDGSAKVRKEVYLRSARTDASRLFGQGLANAKPTTADKVLRYFDAINEDESLNGTHILSNASGAQHALFYTFYLVNASDVEQEFNFSIQLDAYLPPRNLDVNHPYSYLRIITFIGESNGAQFETTIYGAANDQGIGTEESPLDNREAISTFETVSDGETFTYRKPTYFGNSTGFCNNFLENGPSIISQNRSILPQTVTRYSIALYLEGNDPDCTRSAPEGCRMSLSARFGDAI